MSSKVPEVIRNLSRQRAPNFYKVSRNAAPVQIETGQIWSTQGVLELPNMPRFETDEARLVVILGGSGSPLEAMDQVITAPISVSLTMATDFDLVVPSNASPLDFRFMVEVWNEVPALKAHLKQFLGKLADEAITALRSLYVARLLDKNIPDALIGWVGFPIVNESDGRIAFQQAEVEAVTYLAQAATAVLFSEVADPQPKPVQRKRVFELLPKFGFPPYLLGGSKVALASGAPTQNRLFISQTEGDEQFVFELLIRRQVPYSVYLNIHDLSPQLEGRSCVVIIIAGEKDYTSKSVELHKDGQIPVGEDPRFDRSKVSKVIVEID